jgi:hypothetical protein
VFLGTPLEEPFRIVVWVLIGLPIVALILWVALQVFTIQLTFAALMWGVLLAMAWWILYWPIAIVYQIVTGRSLQDIGEPPARAP